MIPVVDADRLKPAALPGVGSYDFFMEWEKKSSWKNMCTVKTYVKNNPLDRVPLD